MDATLDLLSQSAPLLLKGAGYTIALSLIGMSLGLVLGFGLALMRLSRSALLRWPAGVYVSAIRGTPLLVQLFLIYYGLPQFGVELPPLAAALGLASLAALAYQFGVASPRAAREERARIELSQTLPAALDAARAEALALAQTEPARARIAEWAAAENLAGGSASVGAVRTHGFPAMLRLEISDVSRRPAGAEWTATTARIDMHINLTAPGHYILEAKAPISVTRANGARMLIEADALLMSGREDGGSIIDQRIEADRLTIDDPSADGVLSDASTLVGHADAVKGGLTAEENLRFWRDLYGAEDARCAHAVSALEIGGFLRQRVSTLSQGQRRRVALCRPLVSGRPLWLFDEPSAGMDAASVLRVVALIEAHAAAGGAAVIATHEPLPLNAARVITMSEAA